MQFFLISDNSKTSDTDSRMFLSVANHKYKVVFNMAGNMQPTNFFRGSIQIIQNYTGHRIT